MYTQKINKACKVIRTVCKVLCVLSFVGAGLLVIGSFFAPTADQVLFSVGGTNVVSPVTADGSELTAAQLAVPMICEAVSSAFAGIILIFTCRLLSREIELGTLFNEGFANETKKYGIITAALSAASVTIQGVVCAIGDIDLGADVSGESGIAIGVTFILLSVILRAGTEKEKTEI